MNDKRVITYSYLCYKRGLDDTVGFSCDAVVEWCGFKPNYHEKKINEQIAKVFNSLMEKKYITITGDIYRNNHSVATLIPDKFDLPDSFALIYFDEINKIKKFKTILKDIDINRITTATLMLVLAYLRVNMLRRQNDYIGNYSDKPEFCYRYYNDIENDIGISSRYISKAIIILDKLDIIAYHQLYRNKDENNNWHTGVTLFADRYRYRRDVSGKYVLDDNYDYRQELQWGKKYIKEKKYLNKEFYH